MKPRIQCSGAVKARIQCVCVSGSGPIVMINSSSAASSWGSVNTASTSFDLVWMVLEFLNNAAQQ